LPNLARSFWHCLGPDCSRVCLACLGLCRQAPQLAIAQLAIAQLHLQMLCTGMHEQPAGEMLAKSGGFCRRSAPRARGRGSSHVPVWPGAPPPSPHSTALSTAKAVYKSNRGCHHVPRRRHTNLTRGCHHVPRRRHINLNVAANTCGFAAARAPSPPSPSPSFRPSARRPRAGRRRRRRRVGDGGGGGEGEGGGGGDREWRRRWRGRGRRRGRRRRRRRRRACGGDKGGGSAALAHAARRHRVGPHRRRRHRHPWRRCVAIMSWRQRSHTW